MWSAAYICTLKNAFMYFTRNSLQTNRSLCDPKHFSFKSIDWNNLLLCLFKCRPYHVLHFAYCGLGLYNKLPYCKLPDKIPGKLLSNLFINNPVIYAFFRKLNALGLNIFNKTSSVLYRCISVVQRTSWPSKQKYLFVFVL